MQEKGGRDAAHSDYILLSLLIDIDEVDRFLYITQYHIHMTIICLSHELFQYS